MRSSMLPMVLLPSCGKVSVMLLAIYSIGFTEDSLFVP
jgi:hypothetical protein